MSVCHTPVCLSVTCHMPAPPLPPLGHIWDVMLVWRKGNINKNCLCVTVVCNVPLCKVATWLLARLVLDLNNSRSLTACLLCGSRWLPHSQHRPSVIHIGLQPPIIRGVQCRRWNFRKADWASYTLATERCIPLIPFNNISVDESYQRFCGAMQKAAHHSIPQGFCPTYTLCLDEECQDLLKQYEESGDPDIADYLIESLDAAHSIVCKNWRRSN